jgi:hypothetical protein
MSVVSLPARLPRAHVGTVAQILWARTASKPLASGDPDALSKCQFVTPQDKINFQADNYECSVSTHEIHFTPPLTQLHTRKLLGTLGAAPPGRHLIPCTLES